MDELFGKRGKKARRGRAKADANDVRVHARAVNGRLVWHVLVQWLRAFVQCLAAAAS
jgi:hypothetical protein